MLHRSFIFLVGLILFADALAQSSSNLLEQRLTLPRQTTTVAQMLKTIEQEVKCTFSYAGGVIQPDAIVTISANNKSVRDILVQMFGTSIEYTQRKHYIVLTKAKSKMVTSSGYVQDAKGQPVENATVYDPIRLRTARTNQFGYFEIKIKADSIPPLVVSKSGLQDTLLPLQSNGGQLQYITLMKKDTTLLARMQEWPDSIGFKAWQFGQWAACKVSAIAEIQNVRDSLHRWGQIGLLPMIGSNGRLSGNVSNVWSLNVMGGINGGVRGAEVGGVFNIDRANVRYFQCAGVFNLVQGDCVGMQTAGILNLNLAHTAGMQTAGIINSNRGKTQGLQVAGIVNLNAKGLDGLQVAGIYNQCSDTLKGLQVAGLVNRAHRVNGVQIAGVYNRAHVVKGVQIGLINRADSIHGMAFGLISLVKSGYNQLAPYYDELHYAGLQWRTGSNYFYSIFDAACRVQPVKAVTHFAVGYGFGVSSNNRKPWIWNNDFTIHHFLPGKWVNSSDYVGRWCMGVERRIGRILAISVGVTANGYAFKWDRQSLVLPMPQNDILWQHVSTDGWNYKAWVGWRCGVRFNLNPKPRRS